MKQIAKYLLISSTVVVLLLSISGCNSSYEDKGATAKLETTTDKSNDSTESILNNVGKYLTRGSSLTRFMIRNGVKKEGLITGALVYDGTPIELGYSVSYDNSSIDTDIPAIMMVLINNKISPISVNGSEETYIYRTSSHTNESREYIFTFSPTKLYSDKNNTIDIFYIPFGEHTEQASSVKFGSISYKRDVVSSVDIDEEGMKVSTDVIMDSCDNMYGKGLGDMLGDSNVMNNSAGEYILEHNGELIYVSAPNESLKITESDDFDAYSFKTILFCDGELFEGFNGSSVISWEAGDGDTAHYTIDTSSLEQGEHEIYAVNINTQKKHKNVYYSNIYKFIVD